MRILFIFPRREPYSSQSVREYPSGGTEKSVIFLGEALKQLGHQVFWATTPAEMRDYCNLLAYNFDVVVTQEAEALQAFPPARKVWWTHHFSDQPIIKRNAAFARCYADKVVTLSECHANDFKHNLKIDSVVIGHGVWHSEIAPMAQKDPFRLIYASTPFRGLEKIPALFAQIRQREPRASIIICSSMGTYGEAEKDAEYQRIFDELAKMDGVELKGALNQAELYAEYAKASTFFYPCSWRETYCCALDEALAHGCTPIVPDIGALPERAAVAQDFIDIFNRHIDVKQPKDWLQIARQWEKEVLK